MLWTKKREAYLEDGWGHDENDDAGGAETAEEDKDGQEDDNKAGDHVLPELLSE